MNKREYGLHVFMESLYNDIRESYLKNIKGNCVPYLNVFCPNTGEYGPKKPVFAVVLCSVKEDFLVVWGMSFMLDS